MATSTTPKKPVENWETVRDEWIAVVEKLFREISGWSRARSWAVLEERKTITEDRLGANSLPRLLIHASFGRMVLDPISRYVVGASGLIEFSELPSYDCYLIAREAEGDDWFIQSGDVAGLRRLFNEQTFIDTVNSFEIARQ